MLFLGKVSFHHHELKQIRTEIVATYKYVIVLYPLSIYPQKLKSQFINLFW